MSWIDVVEQELGRPLSGDEIEIGRRVADAGADDATIIRFLLAHVDEPAPARTHRFEPDGRHKARRIP